MLSNGAKGHVFYTQRDWEMSEGQNTKEMYTTEVAVK